MEEVSIMDLTNELFSGKLREFFDNLMEMRGLEPSLGDGFFDSPEDPLSKLKYYAPFVEQGNAIAKTLSANILLYLKDGSKIQDALALLESAVSQNDYWAAYLLGNVYFQGNLIGQDRKRAVELYEMSAQKHNIYAALLLGKMYEDGIGVTPDLDKAFEYYRIASVDWVWNDGKFAAISLVIRNPNHDNFYEFTQDFRENYLTALAEERNLQAQFLLADAFFRGAYGFMQSSTKACYWANRVFPNADMPDDPYADLFSVYLAFARTIEEGRFDAAHKEKGQLENICKAHFNYLKSQWRYQDVIAEYCKHCFEPFEFESMIDHMM